MTQDSLIVIARGEEVALELARVVEVVALADLTPVPTAPPAIRGLLNLRGQLVPVVDLAAAISGVAPVDVTLGGSVVVVEAPAEDAPLRAALVVDRIVGLRPGGDPLDLAGTLGKLRPRREAAP